MAEIFPDEGLDHLLGIWPANGSNDATLDLCLFSNFTATTVMSESQTRTNVTQAAFTNYAPESLTAATWGAIGDGASGRKRTYPQVTFPTCGATGDTLNGFHIEDAGNTLVVCMANFDDLTAVVLAENDIIKVTPTVEFVN
jgi:hypothetical protein